MLQFLAQIPDGVVSTLAQGGVLGAMCAFLMWRDVKRESDRGEAELRREQKIDRLIDAVNHLTRSNLLDVMTRPNIVARAKAEAQEILEAVESGQR
jgi:hypothetical protein